MAERMYIQNNKARTQGNHTVTGSTCCATLPACSFAYEPFTGGSCQPSPPSEFDVTLPVISISSGVFNCSAALCNAIFGKTYTLSYTTTYSNICAAGFPSTGVGQWLYAANNYCAVSNTTAGYSGTDACLAMNLRIGCNFLFGAGVDSMSASLVIGLYDNNPLVNGSWNSWVWQGNINDVRHDCNTETFVIPFTTAAASHGTGTSPCSVAQYPGTVVRFTKH